MNEKIIIGILAATYSVAFTSSLILINTLKAERQKSKKLYDILVYMVTALEHNGVDLSEFDLIAISTIWENDD